MQRLWNGLCRDFPRLPRLSYVRALSLVVLWGFAFVLVLSMISGARELMTPGAWEKQGLTYQLADPDDAERQRSMRWTRLAELKVALWSAAGRDDGTLPTSIEESDVPAERWETTDLTRAPFVYKPGATLGDASAVVVHEPEWFDPPLLVLMGDGVIREMLVPDLQAALDEEVAR